MTETILTRIKQPSGRWVDAALRADTESVELDHRDKSPWRHRQWLKPPKVEWAQVLEVRDCLATEGWIVVDYGNTADGAHLIYHIKGADAANQELLAALVAGLPRHVRKCPECGGSVVDGVCETCGRSPGRIYRQQGWRLIVGGLTAIAMSGLLSVASTSLFPGYMVAFIGLGAAGLVAVAIGVRRLVSGR